MKIFFFTVCQHFGHNYFVISNASGYYYLLVLFHIVVDIYSFKV